MVPYRKQLLTNMQIYLYIFIMFPWYIKERNFTTPTLIQILAGSDSPNTTKSGEPMYKATVLFETICLVP